MDWERAVQSNIQPLSATRGTKVLHTSYVRLDYDEYSRLPVHSHRKSAYELPATPTRTGQQVTHIVTDLPESKIQGSSQHSSLTCSMDPQTQLESTEQIRADPKMSEKPDLSDPPTRTPSDIIPAAEGDRDVEAAPVENYQENVTASNPRKDIKTWEWILSLLGLYLGAMLYGLDTTIAADVQASVYETLGHIENLPWVGLGFPMASVAIILLVGRLYGLFNIKVLMLSSIFLFEVGSAVCGAAPTSDALIVGYVRLLVNVKPFN